MFFASGTCANDDGCSFCHSRHQKRVAHLDKRNRAFFESLGLELRTSLLLSLLRQKVVELGLLDEVQPQMDALDAACGVRAAGDLFGGKKNERMLRSALAGMAFRPLLGMLERTVGDASPQVVVAAQALWGCCRVAYSDRGIAVAEED